MTENDKLQVFEDQTIRTAWDEEKKNGIFRWWTSWLH